MHDIEPERYARLARELGPRADDVVERMDSRAQAEGFPTVGPEVGGWLRMLTRMVDAKRVFEFGSGFGYSAYWFAEALPADGELVLTEVDADELADAREFLAEGGYADRCRFEHGDALETIEEYDGPFDVVLIDNEKSRYGAAFEAVRGKVAPGGVVVADNAMTAGPIDFDDLLALVEGQDVPANEATKGVADYLARVGAAPEFETGLIPLGEGIAVSHKEHER